MRNARHTTRHTTRGSVVVLSLLGLLAGSCFGAEWGFTGWRLFNAFTEALKGRNLEALPKRRQALHGLLDTARGVAA